MGNRAVNFVRESRRAGGFAQAVLLYLAECMNDVTGQCNPSRDTIAEFFSSEDSPCTIKRVERALARLRELGFIVSTRVPYSRQTEFGMEGGWSNSYTLVGYETGATPKTCVTPILSGGHPQNGQWVTPILSGGHPQNGQWVTPILSGGHPQNGQWVTPILSGGHPQNGGIKQKETEEKQKEPEDRANSDVSLTLTPVEKPKRKRDPLVPCPETLPDEWREAAKIARPDIDPIVVWRKFWARHGPTSEKKALKTWKRMFLGWIGREYGSTYASQNRFAGGAPRRYADERYRGEDGDEIDYTYGIGKGGRPLRMG